jgi:hypothetical protein
MIEESTIKDDMTFRIWVVQTLTKLESVMDEQAKHRADIEIRVRVLEKTNWKMIGATGAITAGLTYITTLISHGKLFNG